MGKWSHLAQLASEIYVTTNGIKTGKYAIQGKFVWNHWLKLTHSSIHVKPQSLWVITNAEDTLTFINHMTEVLDDDYAILLFNEK